MTTRANTRSGWMLTPRDFERAIEQLTNTPKLNNENAVILAIYNEVSPTNQERIRKMAYQFANILPNVGAMAALELTFKVIREELKKQPVKPKSLFE